MKKSPKMGDQEPILRLRITTPKRIGNRKKWRAEEEERHKGSLTPPKTQKTFPYLGRVSVFYGCSSLSNKSSNFPFASYIVT
jgi:hypothetical protein